MTKEEILSSYGDLPCRFSSYYKFDFAFRGIADDGTKVVIHVGGCSDDIYRFSVDADTPVTLKSLDGDYHNASVYRDGAVIWEDFR